MHTYPGARESLLLGIGAGFGVGGVRFLGVGPGRGGVFGLFSPSLFSSFPPPFPRSRELDLDTQSGWGRRY